MHARKPKNARPCHPCRAALKVVASNGGVASNVLDRAPLVPVACGRGAALLARVR